MPQLKSKKILLYVFLFLLIGTFNNKDLNDLKFVKIKSISVIGLNDKDNFELENDLNFLKIQNLFSLDKKKIIEIMNSNNLIERYSVFKIYPSKIDIIVDRTKFLAQFKKANQIFLLGSNGKFIESDFFKSNIPIIFGDFEVKNFFDLKSAIQETNFIYKDIKNLYSFSSGRWDIETHNGFLIKLPKDNLKRSLELLTIFLNENTEEEINKIDLRQSNQIITNG
jgi:cell division septal protein FtsQ